MRKNEPKSNQKRRKPTRKERIDKKRKYRESFKEKGYMPKKFWQGSR